MLHVGWIQPLLTASSSHINIKQWLNSIYVSNLERKDQVPQKFFVIAQYKASHPPSRAFQPRAVWKVMPSELLLSGWEAPKLCAGNGHQCQLRTGSSWAQPCSRPGAHHHHLLHGLWVSRAASPGLTLG